MNSQLSANVLDWTYASGMSFQSKQLQKGSYTDAFTTEWRAEISTWQRYQCRADVCRGAGIRGLNAQSGTIHWNAEKLTVASHLCRIPEYSQMPKRCGICTLVLRQGSGTLGLLTRPAYCGWTGGNTSDWVHEDKTETKCSVLWVCLTKTSVSPEVIMGKQRSSASGHRFLETRQGSNGNELLPGQFFEIRKVIKYLRMSVYY